MIRGQSRSGVWTAAEFQTLLQKVMSCYVPSDALGILWCCQSTQEAFPGTLGATFRPLSLLFRLSGQHKGLGPACRILMHKFYVTFLSWHKKIGDIW